MRARAPKEDPQAVADRNRARRQAELDQSDTVQDDAATLTDAMRKIYGFRNLGRRGATQGQIAAATAAAPTTATAARADNAMDQMAMQGLAFGSTLAPATSPRPMPNPNYQTPVLSAKAIRPAVNPNQATAPTFSRGTGAVTVTGQGRAPAPTYSRASGGVAVTNQGRAPAPTYSRASSGVKVTGTGRAPTKDKPKSGRI